MRIIQVNDPSAVQEAVSALQQGFLIVYPTDTAYALGADSMNEQALQAIQALKQRTVPKPLPLIASDLPQVEQFSELSPRERLAAEQYWPGPLTLLVRPKNNISQSITLGRSRVGIRVPNSTFARTLAANLGRPIVATSANLTGAGAQYSLQALIGLFAERADAPAVLIDAGDLPEILPSTIVEFIEDRAIIHRQGSIQIT